MKSSCIITNYNYRPYVSFAIKSALDQSVLFDEIIVVDDCSTDGSQELLAAIAVEHKYVRIVEHNKNMGQLAAFESGVAQTTGDIICFLDADDVYSPTYLQTVLDIYSAIPNCDFLYCIAAEFTDDEWMPEKVSPWRLHFHDEGRGTIRTRSFAPRPFLGGPTSCNSMRRVIASQLFPFPWLGDWKVRADDCLVYASSLAGARKCWIESRLVGYRVHAKNALYGNPIWASADKVFVRELALQRLFDHYCRRFGVSEVTAQLAYLEFRTVPAPNFQLLLKYSWLVLREGTPRGTSRLRALAVMLKWYVRCQSASRRERDA